MAGQPFFKGDGNASEKQGPSRYKRSLGAATGTTVFFFKCTINSIITATAWMQVFAVGWQVHSEYNSPSAYSTRVAKGSSASTQARSDPDGVTANSRTCLRK